MRTEGRGREEEEEDRIIRRLLILRKLGVNIHNKSILISLNGDLDISEKVKKEHREFYGGTPSGVELDGNFSTNEIPK